MWHVVRAPVFGTFPTPASLTAFKKISTGVPVLTLKIMINQPHRSKKRELPSTEAQNDPPCLKVHFYGPYEKPDCDKISLVLITKATSLRVII